MLQREIYQNLWEDRSSQKKWWVCDCCGNHLKVKAFSLKCALTVFILWAATLNTVKYGNPSLLTVIRLLCLGATVFFWQQKIPSEILEKLCPFTLFSPSCSPSPHPHTLGPSSPFLFPFSSSLQCLLPTPPPLLPVSRSSQERTAATGTASFCPCVLSFPAEVVVTTHTSLEQALPLSPGAHPSDALHGISSKNVLRSFEHH